MMGFWLHWTAITVAINKRDFYICILYLLYGMYPVLPQDPCLTARRLTDTPYSRSSIPSPNPDQIYLCDVGKFTADEWVRFDQNGEEAFTFHIPETCVTGPRCGTEAPIWMNGKHPTKDNPGPVSARSCLAIISDDCCDWNQTMQVKYCSPGYFVYQLQPPTGCSSSYCFDDVPTSRLNFYPDMGTSRLECVNGGSVAQVRCYVDGASTSSYARYEARLVVNFDTTDYIVMDNTRHDVVFNLTITNNTKQIKCYTRSYWSFDLSHASGDLQSNTIFTCAVTTTTKTTTTLPTTTTIATTTTTTTFSTTTTIKTITIPITTTSPITTEITTTRTTTTTTTTITTTAMTTTTTIKATTIMSGTTTTTLSSTKITTTTTLTTTTTTSTPTTMTPLYLTNSISSSISTTFLASLPTTTMTIKSSTTSVLPEPAHSASTVSVTTTTHKDEPENNIHIALSVALPLSAIAIGVLILVVLKCCGRYRCTDLYKKMRPASLRSESSTDSSKYLDNSGGSRDNSGGSVENSGGSREYSGGSRDKYGVYIDTDAISPQRLPQSTQNESGYEPLRTNQQDGSLMSKNSKTTDKNSSHHYSTIMSQNSFTSERQPNYQNPPLIY